MENYKYSLNMYREKIEKKLNELDIFLKSKNTYTIKEISKILEIKEEEVILLKETLGLKDINKKNIINLMKNGSSFICKLIKRELDCGSPELYRAEDIAYIYDIKYTQVKKAFEFLSLEKVSSSQVKLILAQIP